MEELSCSFFGGGGYYIASDQEAALVGSRRAVRFLRVLPRKREFCDERQTLILPIRLFPSLALGGVDLGGCGASNQADSWRLDEDGAGRPGATGVRIGYCRGACQEIPPRFVAADRGGLLWRPRHGQTAFGQPVEFPVRFAARCCGDRPVGAADLAGVRRTAVSGHPGRIRSGHRGESPAFDTALHRSLNTNAGGSWYFLERSNNAEEAFDKVYKRAVDNYNDDIPGVSKNAARAILQDIYDRLEFLEMKRIDYDWYVRPPK